ncbi:hypothetical protein P691DRAFT_758573 [Macrolepiota fuliginosa MF-IS2]|uniref:Uncharacterized protein n=1 Tax=Macrolepiota fuliginosa MF-IS2 TaxID=1400762 RepID=A0A9P6C696_9AGAR|nr:hypothetical protein P691DRAFT_758573 [Macrolepiota fuliginosa MF-IS2]
MQFTTILSTLLALSAIAVASPLPVAPGSEAVTITTTATPSTGTPWALPVPSGDTSCVHCDPAFLRAADDEDPETAQLYRRVCARSCLSNA